MKIRCFSVRLQSLTEISDKCYRATDWQGNTDLIPKSQVLGPDYEVSKSDAWWITAWILDKKSIMHGSKERTFWVDKQSGNYRPFIDVEIEHHIPEPIQAKEIQPDANLIR